MFISNLIVTSLSLAFATTAYASPLQVKILSYPVVCKPAPISFSGGQPPYSLSIIKDGNTAGAPIVNFGNVGSGNSYTWLVNVPADTVISVLVSDSTGASNFSIPVPVEGNAYTGCVNLLVSTTSAPSMTSVSTISASSTTPVPVVVSSTLFMPTTISTAAPVASTTAAVNSTTAVVLSTLTANLTSIATAKPTSGSNIVRVSTLIVFLGAVVAFSN